MVTEWLIGLLSGVFGWLIESVPMIPPPGWFFEASAGIDQINVMLSSMTVWIPVGLLSGVLTVWLATLLAGWGLKLGRIVLSLFTAGGGSAA